MKNLRLELQHRSSTKASSVGETGPRSTWLKYAPRTHVDG
jgi:hypothetical protein